MPRTSKVKTTTDQTSSTPCAVENGGHATEKPFKGACIDYLNDKAVTCTKCGSVLELVFVSTSDAAG